MTTIPSSFLVFDSKAGPKGEDQGLTSCLAAGSNVQWPTDVRRGRPRKVPKDRALSVKKSTKPSHASSAEAFGFINYADGQQSNDSNTRKFVRTHVMQNFRWQKQIAAQARLGSPKLESESSSNDMETVSVTELIIEVNRSPSLSPERWRTDPFDCFPLNMKPYMFDLLHMYVSLFSEQIFPLEISFGFNPMKRIWVPLALTDPALLNSILFGGDQCGTLLNCQKERPSAIHHLKEAIRMLNERLQDSSLKASDSTIATAAGIAMTEQSNGNHANWRIHMMGVKHMVEMRGGLSAFESNPILHDKLCRADMCGSVPELSRPCLGIECLKLQLELPESVLERKKALPSGFQAIHNEYGFDPDFLNIISRVHAVTKGVNVVTPRKSEAIPMVLLYNIRSIQYYLLSNRNYEDFDGADSQPLKATSLGILLFLGIIQNDFWISPVSNKLIQAVKSSLRSDGLATESMTALCLWLSFLAASVVLDPTEKSWFFRSIADRISLLSLSSWYDTKVMLESFAWAEKVQDKFGQVLWDEAMELLSSMPC